MSSPGVEPGLLRPRRDVLTTRRWGPCLTRGSWRYGGCKKLPILSIQKSSSLAGTCGLVVTSAPHAEGRQLDPGQVYHFGRAHLQLMKRSSSVPVSQVIELRKDRHASRWRGPVEHCRALPARRAANRILISPIGATILRRQAVISRTHSRWKRWRGVCTEVLHCWL